jgi:CRISPR/Cas system CMR-associated protein Cmr5 small subunit
MDELKSALELLNIKCQKCLDTKKLWSRRQDHFDPLDEFKNYDIYSCHDCSKGEFIKFNPIDITHPIINRCDNSVNTRMNMIRPIIAFIESKKEKIENILDHLYQNVEWTYYLNQNYTNVINIKNINKEIYRIKKHIIEDTKKLDKNIKSLIENLKIIIIQDNAKYRIIERNKDICIILTISSTIIHEAYYYCFTNMKLSISINYKIVKTHDYIINKIFTDLF